MALLQIPGIGYQRIKLLLQQKDVRRAEDVFQLSIPALLRIDGIGESIAKEIVTFKNWDQADRILEKTGKLGAKMLSISDPGYPLLLRQIYDAPPLLWYRGDVQALAMNGIAVVGTRNAGRYGLNQAVYWTRELSAAGLSVISGLAHGIDAAAHKAAVEAGGKTIAVLGSGIDWIYPEKHTGLAASIVESGGVVMTEFPPGTKPDAGNFPERNRVVSGMSLGVLVIESGLKGGSMITARYALDHNREVFVVPHPLNHVRGEGNNYLIKRGQGKLIQKPSDIYEELQITVLNDNPVRVIQEATWKKMSVDEAGAKICTLLEDEALHIDEIVERTGSNIHHLLPKLLELEMIGAVGQKAGRYFELKYG